MTNPDTSTFIKLTATDKNSNAVEFLIHKDRVAYIIGDNVYLKGEKAMIMLSLELGDIKLTDFKLPEKQGEPYMLNYSGVYES